MLIPSTLFSTDYNSYKAGIPSLIGWWLLDEASGTTAVAKKGSNGTYDVATSNTAGPLVGVTNNAMVCNGSTTGVNCPVSLTTPYTVEIWDNDNGGFYVWLDAGVNGPQCYSGSWGIDSGFNITFTNPPVNVWNHYAQTDNGTTIVAYVNGVSVGTHPTYSVSKSSIYAGRQSSGNYRVVGAVANLGVYSTALDANTIHELYRRGKGTA